MHTKIELFARKTLSIILLLGILLFSVVGLSLVQAQGENAVITQRTREALAQLDARR